MDDGWVDVGMNWVYSIDGWVNIWHRGTKGKDVSNAVLHRVISKELFWLNILCSDAPLEILVYRILRC